MIGGKILTALVIAGSLAVGTGLALAATPGTTPPEAAKTPAVSPAATTPGAKEATESKATQQAEKARAAQEKGEKEVAADRTVRGTVTAVDVAAQTLMVNVMRGKTTETVGVEVPAGVKITQGKTTKALADLKVGDTVRMTYDRLADKLVADQIHLLTAAPVAARRETPKKSS
jgi:molybdopterin-binding protein